MSLQVDAATRARLMKFVEVKSNDDCWNWLGCVVGKSPKWLPYKNGLSCSPAKAMYQLYKGEIPEGRKVTRTCDNSLCCNPKHLVTDVERFWSKVDKTPGLGIGNCWLWTDTLKHTGYGDFRSNGKTRVMAHRFAYEITNGSIPDKMFICHACDIKSCVNPAHLFIGTATDNQEDMTIKGRGRFGSRNGAAVLTETDVIRIRALLNGGMSQESVAKLYGVGQNTISRIHRKITWSHVR